MRAVLFRCDAGREDGLGHLMRCLVLADALRHAGIEVRFCVGGDVSAAADRVQQRGYTAMAADAIGTPSDAALLATLPRDVLILDSRRVTAAYANALARAGFVACIDDAGIAGLAVDMIVNTNLDAGAAAYPARSGGDDLFGPGFNLIDPRFFTGKSVRETAAQVLLTFGGEDPGNHSCWAIEHLAPAFGAMRATVVIGPAHPDPGAVVRAARAKSIDVVMAPPSLFEWVQAADLAISAGGTTCYELAAAGVPTLAVAIEPHQEPLIHALAATGACVGMGGGANIDMARARALLHRYATDASARRQMHAAQKKLFAGPGASRIVERIRHTYRKRAA